MRLTKNNRRAMFVMLYGVAFALLCGIMLNYSLPDRIVAYVGGLLVGFILFLAQELAMRHVLYVEPDTDE